MVTSILVINITVVVLVLLMTDILASDHRRLQTVFFLNQVIMHTLSCIFSFFHFDSHVF